MPLVYAEQPNPPKRPTRYDEGVKRAAAELLLPDIIQWLGSDWRESERDDYITDLTRVVNMWDGYEAARELERRHWSPDAELVELLSGSNVWHAEEEAVKAWVAANGITPKLAVGDAVKTKHGEGTIVAINTETATYTVQTAEHLREHPGQQGKVSGIILACEDVRPLASSDTALPAAQEDK